MSRMQVKLICAAFAFFAVVCQGAIQGIARGEFEKYARLITGKDAPPATFFIDEALDVHHDEYAVASEDGQLVFRGANDRALLYAVYAFFSERCGCRWYWDGDSVPKADRIDVSGVDIRSSSAFEYRAIRYFAHRGLTRFQAEHWSFEDWKREIDWCLKNRLNTFMLRIGQDDLFQKAFPDICPYPDPAKPLPEAMKGYDNRSLFWSLQYRGELRKKVMTYAFERGLMSPEDFGTMSHWYSRTPYSFLEKMKPPFLPQQGGCYGHPTDSVWDIRDKKWLDAYWRLTQASIDNYGRPELLHTIGIAERHCFTNRADNLRMKVDMLGRLVDNAAAHYPASKVLFAGWDFYCTWKADEVRNLVLKLDPSRVLLWDYEADAYDNTNFTEWDVIGKFPYTFGTFYGLEQALDIRTCYDRIVERQKKIVNDPMCKGYIYWPESSHADPLGIAFFAANVWKADKMDVHSVLSDFCGGRYGDQAEAMKHIWLDALPISTNADHLWYGNAGSCSFALCTDAAFRREIRRDGRSISSYSDVPRVLCALSEIRWEGDFVRRDTVDLARTVADRLLVALMDNPRGNAPRILPLIEAFADLLALHTDYSLYESFIRLDATERIANPEFDKVLFDNAVCDYCASHQYEPFAHVYLPWWRYFAQTGVRPGDSFMKLAKSRRLVEMRPILPRTPESYRKVLRELASAATRALEGKPNGGEPFLPVLAVPEDGADRTDCFPELEFFRNAMPQYAISRWTTPRITRFVRYVRPDELPAKYLRRVRPEEARQNPYRVSDIVLKADKFFESDYVKSGKPFQIANRASRPPFILPKTSPLADRADYLRWKAAHPGFLGFVQLSEFDADSENFTENYETLRKDGARAELTSVFRAPDQKGLACRVDWAKECLSRCRELMFGERDFITLCSCYAGFLHILCALEPTYVFYEATPDQAINAWNLSGSFLRGAARQRKLSYGWYVAQNYNGFNRAGQRKWGNSRWTGGDPALEEVACPHRGESLSLFLRQVLYGWLIGADKIQIENWVCWFKDKGVDGRERPSFVAHAIEDLYQLTKRAERGETYAPFAVLTPLAEPFSSNYLNDFNRRLKEPKVQRAIFDKLVPLRGWKVAGQFPNRRIGEEGCMYNSPFAGFFDVLCPDSGQDSADFADALSRYSHVLIAGSAFDTNAFDRVALASFEKRGGKVYRYPSESCNSDEELTALLYRIQSETMPFRVSGDVQWGVNRTSYGWLVWLINNKGVVKFSDEPETFDDAWTAHVTVTSVTTGETRAVDVLPGKWQLLEFRTSNKGE